MNITKEAHQGWEARLDKEITMMLAPSGCKYNLKNIF